MAGINYPLWYTLKNNIVTQLQAIATEENIVDTGRNFIVSRDRWRPWIEDQQNIALANIMIQNIGTNNDRSGSRRNALDDITVFVDMYALGKAGEVLPADEVAAMRLDLLVAQVREGLTRLRESDFGFVPDPSFGHYIDRDLNFSLTYYDQENETVTGQYAPARWSFDVQMPFIPTDNNDYTDLEQLNISVKDADLEKFKMTFNY